MKDKDILNMLGLNDRTITLGVDDEYLQITLEKKIDNYLKKIEEEKKKQEEIDYYKKSYEEYKEKQKFINTFNDSYVYKNVRQTLANDGFTWRCAYCKPLDVSGGYGKPLCRYHNHNN